VKTGAFFFQKCRRRLDFLAFYRFRFICVFFVFRVSNWVSNTFVNMKLEFLHGFPSCFYLYLMI